MTGAGLLLQSGIVSDAVNGFVADVTGALPTVMTGLAYLVVAVIAVKVVMYFVKGALSRALPGDSPVYRQFLATIVAVFLWFGVLLSTLSILGLNQIAAALGTASGFLALGVSYALSGMIADAVAGIYLLRDKDFNPGDTVVVGDMTGEVLTIELRKTRFAVEDDTVVRANAEIEKRWTKEGVEEDPAASTAAGGDAA